MNNVLLSFGLKDGALVHISDAKQGFECGCVCPGCGEPLVARKGDVNAHHFAHRNGSDCARAVESALHLASKRILADRRQIALPGTYIHFNSYRDPLLIAPKRTYVLDDIREECRTGDVIPDLLVFVGATPLMVEIRVTHAVDDMKLQKIRALGISAIEIDLSRMSRSSAPDELAHALVHDVTKKRWLFNARAEALKRLLLSSGEKKPTIQRGLALHVDRCPIRARIWRGKSYANVIDDCIHCQFALELGDEMGYVLCGGRDKITTLDELRQLCKRVGS